MQSMQDTYKPGVRRRPPGIPLYTVYILSLFCIAYISVCHRLTTTLL